MYPFSPGTGAGRPVEPPVTKPEPEKPAAEGASPTQNSGGYAGHARHGSELPPSDRGPLAPAFTRFAESLNAELAADEAIRRSKVNEVMGLSEQEKLAAHREALAEAVRDNSMSESEATAVWNRAHSNIDPATLNPRKS